MSSTRHWDPQVILFVFFARKVDLQKLRGLVETLAETSWTPGIPDACRAAVKEVEAAQGR